MANVETSNIQVFQDVSELVTFLERKKGALVDQIIREDNLKSDYGVFLNYCRKFDENYLLIDRIFNENREGIKRKNTMSIKMQQIFCKLFDIEITISTNAIIVRELK